uniref:WD_REPEATS_REGION domain-containing protein n=1 Tax=Caenorhabditis tropicalis TaxID=1561998 RepID=A0A1I7T9G8_9PELO
MEDAINEDNIPQSKIVGKYDKSHTRGIVGTWAVQLGGYMALITVSHESSKLFMITENRSDGVVTLQEQMMLESWQTAVQSADVKPDGKYIMIIGLDCCVYETIMAEDLFSTTTEHPYLESVHCAITPDSTGFVTVGFSGSIKEMKTSENVASRSEVYPGAKLTSCLRFSRDGKYLAVGHIDGGIEMLHADTFKNYHKYEVHSMRIRKICFLPGDDRFLSACDDHLIKLNSLTDFSSETDQTRSTKAIRIYSAHDSPVTGLTIDEKSGGTRFASSSASSQIFIWHIELTTPIMSVTNEHTSAIRGLAFTPTGCSLISGGDDAVLFVYSIPGVSEDTPEHVVDYPVQQESISVDASCYREDNEPASESSQQVSQNYYENHEEDITEYQQETTATAQYQEYNPYAEPRTPPQEDDDLGDYVYNTTDPQTYEPTSNQNEYDPAAM